MNSGRHRGGAAATLHHHGPASPQLATRLRRQLIQWARSEGVPAETIHDIGLASYEAMANTVTHAYPYGTVGPLELHARLEDDTVVVTVADHGSWSGADTPDSGRGLELIRRLSTDTQVVRGEYGTTVRMCWPGGPR
ncbi:MAG TPA: ATP-binding protein [Actinophytocola sp.]|jgi:anti-sigma regulatory factor (Ser/Thr protein kinase)|uniref:ATP-binding protein n=1 Tax=Actinophytocola sp. TaxID=1872138 RepID=UPI002F9351C5